MQVRTDTCVRFSQNVCVRDNMDTRMAEKY